MTILTTSLEQIRSFHPCSTGWQNVFEANSQRGWDELFPLKNTVQSNSFSDVCWLLGKLGIKSICVKVAQMCADSVAHLKNYPAERAADSAAAYADAAATYAEYAAAEAAYPDDSAAERAAAYTDAAAVYAEYAATYADAAAEQNLKNKAFLLLAIELYEQGALS